MLKNTSIASELRSSPFINIWSANSLLQEHFTKNKDNYTLARFYHNFPRIVIGVNDWRPRIGTFPSPYEQTCSPLFAVPKLEFINDKLSDLLNERAQEIYQLAKTRNKKIWVMWSGGIDSTLVLTAMLKNIPYNEQPNILGVLLNSTSILENPEFFIKFINQHLEFSSSASFEMSSEFLQKNILLHGDPADCLFGPSTPKYLSFIQDGTYTESWKKHQQRMINELTPTVKSHGWQMPGLSEWFVKETSNNIEQSGLNDYISSVSDWWWWTYFNFKWSVSCMRPFFNYRSAPYNPISYDLQKEFAEYTFFNTRKFNLWTYSNLKSLIPKDITHHKREAKQYIFDFDHNEEYFLYKRKVGTLAPSQKRKLNSAVFFNKEWQPVSFWKQGVLTTFTVLNQRFCTKYSNLNNIHI